MCGSPENEIQMDRNQKSTHTNWLSTLFVQQINNVSLSLWFPQMNGLMNVFHERSERYGRGAEVEMTSLGEACGFLSWNQEKGTHLCVGGLGVCVVA